MNYDSVRTALNEQHGYTKSKNFKRTGNRKKSMKDQIITEVPSDTWTEETKKVNERVTLRAIVNDIELATKECMRLLKEARKHKESESLIDQNNLEKRKTIIHNYLKIARGKVNELNDVLNEIDSDIEKLR
jgi:hypothetical protein